MHDHSLPSESTTEKVAQRPPGHAEISRTPLAVLDRFITPTHLHYVRDHLAGEVRIDPEWRLRIDGLVQFAVALTRPDLERLPMAELPVTMECAGNGGANSVIGGIGCISTAVWRGARLRDVLQLAGLQADGREVVATGVDRGHDPDDPASPESYARSIPLEKALDPATLVALYMNGDVLPPAHGYPARLIVPGWYGMDSVKWLASLRVITGPFDGFYAVHRYREKRGPDGADSGRAVREMKVKALIAYPGEGERIPAGAPCRITGAAWSGAAAVTEVLVSVNGGSAWTPASLEHQRGRFAWQQWEYTWTPKGPGRAVIIARAFDGSGETQPLAPVDGQVYEANWVQPVAVEVEPT